MLLLGFSDYWSDISLWLYAPFAPFPYHLFLFYFLPMVLSRLSFLLGLILSRLEHSRSWLLMILTGTMSELVSIPSLFIMPAYLYLLLTMYHQYGTASIARKIYLRGGLGVGAFRRIYGGSKRNGSRPPHFCESSGAIARHILQQLQKMNIVDLDPKGWVLYLYLNSKLFLDLSFV